MFIQQVHRSQGVVLFLLRAAIRAILKLMTWFSDAVSNVAKKENVCCSFVLSYSFFLLLPNSSFLTSPCSSVLQGHYTVRVCSWALLGKGVTHDSDNECDLSTGCPEKLRPPHPWGTSQVVTRMFFVLQKMPRDCCLQLPAVTWVLLLVTTGEPDLPPSQHLSQAVKEWGDPKCCPTAVGTQH